MTHMTLIPPNMCPPLFTADGSQNKRPLLTGRSRRCVPGLSKPPCC
jgi:hypothetical protein